VILGSRVQLSGDLQGPLPVILDAIKGAELEGAVAKQRDSKYEPANRSRAWLKVQFKRQQEFLIGGYVVGYYEDGKLMFAGKVPGGFNPHSRRELLKAMKPLAAPHCPFANLPSSKTGHWGEGMTAEQMAEIQWLKPKLIAPVKFTEWTRRAFAAWGFFGVAR
jgi:bifunctional non-homologous end joining protein LigD